jgi:hypothetical protein
MSTWGIVALVVGVSVVAVLLLRARGGKADRAARRELRALRNAEKRRVNAGTIRERRGDMIWLSHLPGSRPVESTIDPDAHLGKHR